MAKYGENFPKMKACLLEEIAQKSGHRSRIITSTGGLRITHHLSDKTIWMPALLRPHSIPPVFEMMFRKLRSFRLMVQTLLRMYLIFTFSLEGLICQ